MTPETEQTLPIPTDVKALAAELRGELGRLAISTGEEMPWGKVDALEGLADRYWRSTEEMIMMIVCDWLAHAERHPEIFDRVFGAGPGAGLSMVEAESEARDGRDAARRMD